MRLIAFITDSVTVRDLLIHLGEPLTPPSIAPARGPPLWAAVEGPADRLDPACGRVGPAGTGLRIRSAHRLVVRPPSAPPRLVAGSCG